MADYVIVPTDFCRQYYWDAMGLASLKLPLVMDVERVRVAKPEISNLKSEISNKKEIHKGKIPNDSQPSLLPAGERAKYVTFVNPEPRKAWHRHAWRRFLAYAYGLASY